MGISIALASCSTSGSSTSTTTTTTSSIAPTSTSSSVAPTTTPTTAPTTPTVWLCRPEAAKDPCAYQPSATSVAANGARSPVNFADVEPASTASKFDCFYVYPTSSTESTPNSNLVPQAGEIAAAVNQASPFSGVCNVWAPMYRSATQASIVKGLSGAPGSSSTLRSTFDVAYGSLLSAWNDFVANDDNGLPIILIGHSQGSAILIHLIASQIEQQPSVLQRIVVAIIAGGNVQVPAGKAVGGSFAKMPLCTSDSETGCVIAWSSFPSEPPQNSLFGRAGQGVSLQSEQTTEPGDQVACVNPAALSGGTSVLSPYFIAATQTGLSPGVTTHWVGYPDLYSGSCDSAGGAAWLQVTRISTPGDSRPTITEPLGPTWGYHLDDINLTVGNLIHDVAGEESAWSVAH
ncbi:MAG: DUF3089 domain-containing protein [Acidimicrobiales bacterium]